MKARDESCQNAMFSNAKLRLLMTIVGFERLGVQDVPGASWVIPADVTSKNLRGTISTINKSLVNPMPEGSAEDPRQLLQRRQRSSAREAVQGGSDVHFGSESEGEDTVPDGPLFPPNPRSKSNALEDLKKRRKEKRKTDAEKEPLDDEILEARREAVLSNALARQRKIKSDLYIHASDEESDSEGDREFFRLEEERRKAQAENIRRALQIGGAEKSIVKGKKKSVRKRKSDGDVSMASGETKRQRRVSGSGSSNAGIDDSDDIQMAGLEAQSPRSQPDISTSHGTGQDEDTPLTSGEYDLDFNDDLAFIRDRRRKSPTLLNNEDEEDKPVVSAHRRMRAGFVIDTDSE